MATCCTTDDERNSCPWTIERLLRLIAGSFVVLSLILSQVHSQYWLIFTAFVGLNLFQSGFTNWCPMIWILECFGFKRAGSRTS